MAMLTLVTRQEIAAQKTIIASEIISLQRSFYDEEALEAYREDGEEDLYWEIFDLLQGKPESYQSFHKIIGLNHSDLGSYTQLLVSRLQQLADHLQIQEWIVLSHLRLDFFGNRDNDYAPLEQAYQSLEKLTGLHTYKEAFRLDQSGFAEFIPILFWIQRCDPSVSDYICVFDEQQRISFFICKYGNLHVTEMGQEYLSPQLLQELGWTLIEGPESDPFTDDGAIAGRVIRF